MVDGRADDHQGIPMLGRTSRGCQRYGQRRFGHRCGAPASVTSRVRLRGSPGGESRSACRPSKDNEQLVLVKTSGRAIGPPQQRTKLAPISLEAVRVAREIPVSVCRTSLRYGSNPTIPTTGGAMTICRRGVLAFLVMGTAIAAEKGGSMIGAGGLVASIIVFAVGAVLDWAVTEPYQHGININKVGWILMIVGVVGAVVSIIVMVAGNTRRRRTVVDDGQGNVVRRVDSTY